MGTITTVLLPAHSHYRSIIVTANPLPRVIVVPFTIWGNSNVSLSRAHRRREEKLEMVTGGEVFNWRDLRLSFQAMPLYLF